MIATVLDWAALVSATLSFVFAVYVYRRARALDRESIQRFHDLDNDD